MHKIVPEPGDLFFTDYMEGVLAEYVYVCNNSILMFDVNIILVLFGTRGILQ